MMNEALWKEKFKLRAERLGRLELDAPAEILANEVVRVTLAAVEVVGDVLDVARAWMNAN